jgi:hypothetical protein
MDRNVIEKFCEEEAYPRVEEKLIHLQEEFEFRKVEWKTQFVKAFEQICQNVIQIQQDTAKVPCYLVFHLMRTRIVKHRYEYMVQMYEEDWYLIEGISVGTLQVDFIFRYFEEVWKELLEVSRKYVRKISEADIQYIMQEQVERFHSYVVKLLRYSILEAIQSDLYSQIIKGERFLIQAGEYYELCDYIHMEYKERDYEKIKSWLQKMERTDTYTFEDFRGIDLSNMEFQEMDFRYVDFRDSNLEGIVFQSCNLEGAKFDGCNLADAIFTECNLTDTRFERCNLTEVRSFY